MKQVRIVIEVEGKSYEVRGELVPIATSLSQRAQERDAKARVQKKDSQGNGPGAVQCPEHGKAMLGRHGLFCPVAIGEKPDGKTRYCNWRPNVSQAA